MTPASVNVEQDVRVKDSQSDRFRAIGSIGRGHTGLANVCKVARAWWLTQYKLVTETYLPKRHPHHRLRRLRILVTASRAVVTLHEHGTVILTTEVQLGELTPSALDLLVVGSGRQLRDFEVSLALEASRFFRHELLLPQIAAPEASEVLRTELAQQLPIPLDQLEVSHRVTFVDGGLARAQQLVIRKDYLEMAAQAVGLPLTSIDVVEIAAQETVSTQLSEIELRSEVLSAKKAGVRTGIALCALAIGLGASNMAARQVTFTTYAAALDASIRETLPAAQEARSKHQSLQKAQTRLNALRDRKEGLPDVSMVLELFTTVVPDHTWFSEVRIVDAADRRSRVVTAQGLSRDATGVVALLDRTPPFADSSLAGPVTVDPRDGLDRFSLRVSVLGMHGAKDKRQ